MQMFGCESSYSSTPASVSGKIKIPVGISGKIYLLSDCIEYLGARDYA